MSYGGKELSLCVVDEEASEGGVQMFLNRHKILHTCQGQRNFRDLFLRLKLIVMLVVLSASSALAAPELDATTTVTTIDASGMVGKYSSLALNCSGFPVIS